MLQSFHFFMFRFFRSLVLLLLFAKDKIWNRETRKKKIECVVFHTWAVRAHTHTHKHTICAPAIEHKMSRGVGMLFTRTRRRVCEFAMLIEHTCMGMRVVQTIYKHQQSRCVHECDFMNA